MGIEKPSSKSGNYVGGFLQLFDWNAKSRKKLFSSKSDLPEKSKQKKRSDGNLPTTRLEMEFEEDEAAARPSMKACSVYSCASSVTDEDLYGSKGPGVVARLMGLDPLPKSNASYPHSTPFSDFHSLPDSYYHSKNLDYRQDPQIMQSSRLQQKVIQRPIDKFQSEVLPARSAKTIPITHHKLLSPIKSKTNIPPKDAVQIMEAAARILEPAPSVSRKPGLPLAGSSSVPLKVKDLRAKAQAAQKSFSKLSEASQRAGESRGVKHVRGNSVNKSSNSGSVETVSVSSFQDSAEVSSGVKSKGKSISLALQAKANVQKREALSSTSSKSSISQAETNVFSPTMLFTSQSRAEKTPKKQSKHKNSSVLRQNNQKQNCIVDRGKLPSSSNSQGGKAVKGDISSAKRQNSSKPLGTSKVSSRKLGSEAKNNKSKSLSCTSERVNRKKRSIEGNYQSDENVEVTPSSGSTSFTQSSWDQDSRKAGKDVISFTFTSPMRSTEFQENREAFPINSPSKRMMLNSNGMAASKFSFLGHNIKGGDSLSTFLELQLNELAHKVDFSQQKSGMVSRKSSFMQGEYETRNAEYSFDPLNQPRSSLYSLRDPKTFIAGQHVEGRNISEDRIFLNHRLPSPVSVLEHSSFTDSCNSSDSADSNHVTEGSKNYLSNQSEHSIDTFLPSEVDSASAVSARTIVKRRETTLTSPKYGKSRNWELEYVKEMVCNIDVKFKDYVIGRSDVIFSPHLFHQLERYAKYLNGCEFVSSANRRLVFDCANECMEMRCRGYAAGGYKKWDKGTKVVKGKERLAEDVCREISRWSGMGDFMVDELVESDMSSSPYGRWLDYDVEGFEVGKQIESCILNSLIDEVVADILVL